MNDAGETAAARLWRDRGQIREHERDEARAQARIAAEKVAILSAENDRLEMPGIARADQSRRP